MNSFGGYLSENSGDPYQSQVSEFKEPSVGNPNVYSVMNDFSLSSQVIPNVHFPRLQHTTTCEQGIHPLDYSTGAGTEGSKNLWCQNYQSQSSHISHSHNPSLGNCETSLMNQRHSGHSLDTQYSEPLLTNSDYQHQQDVRGFNSGAGVGGLEVEVDSLHPPHGEIFHYPESSGCGGMGWTEAYSSQWQLMDMEGRELDLDSWGLPLPVPSSSSTIYPPSVAPVDFFSNVIKHKSTKLQTNMNTSSKSSYPTNEDYQQDVLIQQEFQRLDEMLLRDDDDLSCLSDVDQVSVESVVSSEQQYDSPWEPPDQQTVTTKDESSQSSGQLTSSAQQTKFVPATATATVTATASATVTSCSAPDPSRSSHVLTNSRSTTLSSRVAAVVEEFRENCEQFMAHSSQCVDESHRKMPLPQASSAPTSTQAIGKPTVRTVSTAAGAVQAMDSVAANLKKTILRPKTLATVSTSYDTHRRIPLQGNEGQSSFLEQKRTLERIRMDEVRGVNLPSTIQGYQTCPTDAGGDSPSDFSQGSLSARRTTSRLPRIRMEQIKRSPIQQQLTNMKSIPIQTNIQNQTQIQSQSQVQPQNPNLPNLIQRPSFRRKPPTTTSTPVPPEILAPTNMMGISHGDGVWGAIPEMNARMYLPHGILHFKMEYQPTGSRNLSFPTQLTRSQPSQSLQNQLELSSNLAKFTHPIIHMLPLSSDGSTRLNVTFDVLYQN